MKHRVGKYRVGHGGYVSEFEQFLDNFKARHPETEEEQLRGWYIWWDHKANLKELDKERADTVPVKSYSYE